MIKAQKLYVTHHYPGLDILRVLAIVLVAGFHYPTADRSSGYGYLFQWGWTGVDLFFVLSGYLITHQLILPIADGKTLSLKNFYLRRSFRIFPAYLFVVSMYFLFPEIQEGKGISPFWKHLTFTQNIGLDRNEVTTFTHAWSLCVEEHFYLILPLMIIFFRKFLNTFWVTLLICSLLTGEALIRSILWTVYVGTNPSSSHLFFKLIYYPTFSHLDGLVIGVAIALLQVFKPEFWHARIAPNGNFCFLMALPAFAIALLTSNSLNSLCTSSFGFSMFSIGFGFLIVSALSKSGFLGNLKIPGVHSLAALTYSIYLTHKATIKLVHDRLNHLAINPLSIWGTATTLSLVLVVAALVYFSIERPFLALRRQLTL